MRAILARTGEKRREERGERREERGERREERGERREERGERREERGERREERGERREERGVRSEEWGERREERGERREVYGRYTGGMREVYGEATGNIRESDTGGIREVYGRYTGRLREAYGEATGSTGKARKREEAGEKRREERGERRGFRIQTFPHKKRSDSMSLHNFSQSKASNYSYQLLLACCGKGSKEAKGKERREQESREEREGRREERGDRREEERGDRRYEQGTECIREGYGRHTGKLRDVQGRLRGGCGQVTRRLRGERREETGEKRRKETGEKRREERGERRQEIRAGYRMYTERLREAYGEATGSTGKVMRRLRTGDKKATRREERGDRREEETGDRREEERGERREERGYRRYGQGYGKYTGKLYWRYTEGYRRYTGRLREATGDIRDMCRFRIQTFPHKKGRIPWASITFRNPKPLIIAINSCWPAVEKGARKRKGRRGEERKGEERTGEHGMCKNQRQYIFKSSSWHTILFLGLGKLFVHGQEKTSSGSRTMLCRIKANSVRGQKRVSEYPPFWIKPYITGWWFQPLWKISLRQLGWWNSQLNGKSHKNSYPIILLVSSVNINITSYGKMFPIDGKS